MIVHFVIIQLQAATVVQGKVTVIHVCVGRSYDWRLYVSGYWYEGMTSRLSSTSADASH